MKKRRMWLIWSGRMYSYGGCDGVGFIRKIDAEGMLRAKGFKYNTKQKLFINEVDIDRHGLGIWAVIKEGALYEKEPDHV